MLDTCQPQASSLFCINSKSQTAFHSLYIYDKISHFIVLGSFFLDFGLNKATGKAVVQKKAAVYLCRYTAAYVILKVF
jgi:hypothetical protein